MTREEALILVKKYTKNKNLIKHMLAVEAAMVAYAKKLGEDEEKWAVCGLLHDIDYEKMGEDHPSEWGKNILEEASVEEDIIDAIMHHDNRSNADAHRSIMSRALAGVDPLTGFIVACALVRPGKLSDVEVGSVKRSMKKKEFAKSVNRDDIIGGANLLCVDLDDHIKTVLDAMKGVSDELGL